VKISSYNCDGISKESDAEIEASTIVFQQQEAKTPLNLEPPDMVLPLEVKLKISDKYQVTDIVCCLLTVGGCCSTYVQKWSSNTNFVYIIINFTY
jgi:hypothetical protein